jgi:hypothetical protein
MDKNTLKPLSLSITMAGTEHSATIRFEVDGDAFRIVHLEDGNVLEARQEKLLAKCMDYASACVDSGMMMLAPGEMRDALVGRLVDGLLARAAGPTN